MASCSKDKEDETTATESTTMAPATTDDKKESDTSRESGTTEPEPAQKDEPLVLMFEDDWTTTAQVEEKREITVPRSSNRVVITGEGNFTVTYTAADGEKTLTAENGSLTFENTATPHMGMVLTVSVEKSMTLTFTLDFDKGVEENPYDVAEEGATTVTFTKDAYIRITKAGWYSLEGQDIELTNYSLENDGRVFLAAGVYGLSTTSAGEVSAIVTLLETPTGYDASDPAAITALDTEVSLDLYDGVTLYFAYTAEEAGIYEISLGSEGKSPNSRFAIDREGYETYYGRYYTEDGEWLTCPGGKTATVVLSEGQTVIIAVDYTLSGNMAGGDAVAVLVKAGEGAIDMTDGEGSAKLAQGGKLIFCFTAPEAGVYEANLGNGETCRNSRFTSGMAEAGVYYGADCDASSARLRLKAGETVYFIVNSPSGAEGNILIFANKLTEESWPDSLREGTYADKNNSITLTFDPTARTLVMNDLAAVHGYYLDGTLSFTVGTGEMIQSYTLTLAENGTDLELSWVKTSSETGEQTVTRTLSYQEPVDPVRISLWEGVYSYTDADGKTTKLTIYSDGSGLFGTSRYNISDNGCEYTGRNVLQWQKAYTMTIAEQDKTGKVTKISVEVYGEEGSILFALTDEAVVLLPSVLPISVDDKFTGANGYQLYYQGSYQYFNDRVFTIIGYDEASKTYTIAGYDTASGDDKAEATYRLTIVDAETVKVYDAEGTDLLDTLNKEKPIEIPDLKADGKKETSLARDDAGLIYLKVAKTGWYTFTALNGDTTELFTTCTVQESGKPSADVDSKQTLSMTSGLLLKLTEGTLLGFYGDVSVTYSETEPKAKLGSEKNPYVMEGSTLDVTGLIDGKNVYYVSYTASAAGTYDIGFNIDRMHFVVNSKDYGQDYDWDNYKWIKDYPAKCTVELAAGETVVIALNRPTTTGDDAFIGVAPTGTLDDVLDAATAANKPIPVTSFATEQQGEYKYSTSGWDSVSYTLTLNANGKVDLVRDGESMGKNLSVTLTGDTYSFTYEYYGNDLTATFTFQDGGIAFKENEYSDEVLLTTGGGSSTTESLFDKDEQGTWADEDWDHILIVSENSIYGEIEGVEFSVTADDLDKTLDGLSWKFTCDAGTVQFRLTEVSGTPAMILLVNDKDYTLYAG